MKTYFQTADQNLFEFNLRTGLYYRRNTVQRVEPLQSADFEKMEQKQIKKSRFSELMNQYFAKVEHKWYYDGVLYRKMQNFSKEGVSEGVSVNQMPRHEINSVFQGFYAYHWGKVYLVHFYKNYFGSPLLLYVPKTRELLVPDRQKKLSWTRIQHLAPIMNEFNKTVC